MKSERFRTECVASRDRSDRLAERAFAGLVLGAYAVFIFAAVMHVDIPEVRVCDRGPADAQPPVAVRLCPLDYVTADRGATVVAWGLPLEQDTSARHFRRLDVARCFRYVYRRWRQQLKTSFEAVSRIG